MGDGESRLPAAAVRHVCVEHTHLAFAVGSPVKVGVVGRIPVNLHSEGFSVSACLAGAGASLVRQDVLAHLFKARRFRIVVLLVLSGLPCAVHCRLVRDPSGCIGLGRGVHRDGPWERRESTR